MKYAAVIVETRIGQKYVDVIKQHMKHLPGWDLVIVTNEEKFSYYHQRFSSAYLYNCQEIKDANDYNRLLTSFDFWGQFEYYDKVLIFQHDSMILREGVEEFIEYDFIGAPLYHIDFPAMNGGFSLRSPKAMMEIWKLNSWNSSMGNEDISACKFLSEGRYNLPTKEVAQLFSIETIYGLGSFGVHAIDKWHNVEKVNEILTQYN